MFRLALLALFGCDGPQSTLAPAGRDAALVADLFWWMAGGGSLVWLVVMGSAVYAVRRGKTEHDERAARRFILWGGVVFPAVAVTTLLVFGLRTLPGLLSLGPEDSPKIHVSAEQWWWRFGYEHGGDRIAVGNELRLPVGRRTTLAITSPDVIHALWVPALGGKVDAIPGRTTYLALEPTRAGEFRGVCAEYCGVSHAPMRFDVVAMEPDAYARWLASEAADARPPSDPRGGQAEATFLASGCGACHTVRGTEASGVIGPDLTHVGSRRSVAGVLENDAAGFEAWLRDPAAYKPGVHMPAFGMLADRELATIAAYLETLQ